MCGKCFLFYRLFCRWHKPVTVQEGQHSESRIGNKLHNELFRVSVVLGVMARWYHNGLSSVIPVLAVRFMGDKSLCCRHWSLWGPFGSFEVRWIRTAYGHGMRSFWWCLDKTISVYHHASYLQWSMVYLVVLKQGGIIMAGSGLEIGKDILVLYNGPSPQITRWDVLVLYNDPSP